jgi:hypothetical protein
MASFVWNRDFDEAYVNPYEYPAQKQFVGEAGKILTGLSKALDRHNMRFDRNDTSIPKAVWMLHNDAVDALREALALLKKEKHTLVGRIFRDVWESWQMVEYFLSQTSESQKDLKKWFQDEIITHGIIRDRLKKDGRTAEADERRQRQRELSKLTHRSYRAMLKGYSLGSGNKMVYDNFRRYSTSVHTISAYYAILGWLIIQTSESIEKSGLVTAGEIKKIWKRSMEKTTVPRRFAMQKSLPVT